MLKLIKEINIKIEGQKFYVLRLIYNYFKHFDYSKKN
jgi:hypothetical protein